MCLELDKVLTLSCSIQIGISEFQSKQQSFTDAVAFLAPPPQCVLSITSSQGGSSDLVLTVTVATFAAYLPVTCSKLGQSYLLKAQLIVRGFPAAQIGVVSLDQQSIAQCASVSQTPESKNTLPSAANHTDEIIPNFPCPAGSELIGATCNPCVPGTFAPAPSLKRCTLCPEGTFIHRGTNPVKL